MKTGCHTEEFQAFGRALNAYGEELKAQLALLTAALPRKPTCVLYLIQTPTRCYTRTLLKGRPQPAAAGSILRPLPIRGRLAAAAPGPAGPSAPAHKAARMRAGGLAVLQRLDAVDEHLARAGRLHG
jgi:hypothetical protein